MDVIPTLRYRDADAAVAFLTDAFGFAEHEIFRGEDGTVVHAELRFGDGMIMLGADRPQGAELNADVGGSSVYCILDEVDEHYARAVAAGATILRDLEEASYGGKGYTARDPEGNLWSFGSYRPAARG